MLKDTNAPKRHVDIKGSGRLDYTITVADIRPMLRRITYRASKIISN